MEIDLGRVSRRAFTLCSALLLAIQSVPLAAQEIRGFELALVDLSGKKQVLGTLPTTVYAPRFAPDGKRVAFEVGDPPSSSGAQVSRVYIAELARVDQRRALPLVGKGRNWAPVWFPDGERLVFLVSGESPDALWTRRADGTGDAEQLVDGRAPEGVTANGQQLAFITRTGNRDYGISLLDMGSKNVKVLVDQPNSEQHSSRISPEGRWIAYSSNETGRQELWVEPLPQTGQRHRVTSPAGAIRSGRLTGRRSSSTRTARCFACSSISRRTRPRRASPTACRSRASSRATCGVSSTWRPTENTS
jgi:Tol biopolymer transport system component